MTAVQFEGDFQKIGNVIQFHRKQAGLSRIELAEIANVGKTSIYDVEHGKATIRFETLQKILSVLNICIRLESPLMDQFKEAGDEKS